MTRRVSAPLLVDRAGERATLAAAWAEAVAAVPRTVLVTGEAGIGKTRLLDALAEDLRGTDALVLRGGCVPLGGHAPPYAPFRTALADLTSGLGRAAVRELAGPRAPALSRLVPGLADLPEADHDADAGGGPWPDDVVDVVTRTLHAASMLRPVALLVEDLHWADPASLDLVGYLARVLRTSRVLLVATLREEAADDAVTDLVDELVRLPEVERLRLPRLGRAGVVAAMTGILGAAPDAVFAEEVVTRSEGVPFLVEELTAAGPAGAGSLDRELRDVLLHSTRALSGPAATVLRAAAAAGGPVDEDSLAAVTRLDHEPLRTALRELVDHRLLVVARRQARYDFRHALLREAVADDLLPGEAVELHQRYAVLAEQADGGRAPDVARAAFHWWEAGDAAHALPALVAAAAAARSVSAYGEELRLLERAGRLWSPEHGPARSGLTDRAALLAATGRAARLAGRYEAARDLLAEARRELGSGVDPLRRAEVVWEESLLVRSLGELPGVEAAIRELLAELPGTPTAPLTARAHALNALLQFQLHRHETAEAGETVLAALDAARAAGEVAVAAHLRVTGAGLGLDDPGGGAPADPGLLAQPLQDAERLDDVPLMLRVLEMRSRLHHARGEVAAAEDDARAGLDLAARRGSPVLILDYLVGDLCDALLSAGRWAEALAVLDDAVAVDRPNLERAGLQARRALLLAVRGDLAAARAVLASARHRLERAVPDPSLAVLVATVEAEVALREGRPSAAVDTARAAYVGPGAQVGPHLGWPLLRVAAAASRGTSRRGRARAPDWLPDAVAALTRRDPTSWWVPVLDAWLRGDDVGGWDAAVSATTRGPALVRLDVLLAAAACTAAAGDRDRATALLADLLAAAEVVGASPHAAAAEDLAERARLKVPGREGAAQRSGADGLTARELDVLRLLAAGRANAQIAAELVISTKTVSVHVSHILDKLGVASRGEAAATAWARGLVQPPRPT